MINLYMSQNLFQIQFVKKKKKVKLVSEFFFLLMFLHSVYEIILGIIQVTQQCLQQLQF